MGLFLECCTINSTHLNPALCIRCIVKSVLPLLCDWVYVLFRVRYFWPLCANSTSSIKPEVRNISQRRHTRTEPRPQATWQRHTESDRQTRRCTSPRSNASRTITRFNTVLSFRYAGRAQRLKWKIWGKGTPFSAWASSHEGRPIRCWCEWIFDAIFAFLFLNLYLCFIN